jgi:hypothetical protein
MDFAELVGLAGVVKDAFGERCFARVDVRHDPDVPGPAERVLTQVRQCIVALSVAHFFLSRYAVVRRCSYQR